MSDSPSIRERRVRLGLSRQALATAAGVSIGSVERFELGMVPVRYSKVLPRIEGALDELEQSKAVSA